MIGLMFPGQGAQSPNMIKAFLAEDKAYHRCLSTMSSMVGRDIRSICDEISAAKRCETDIAQLAVFAVSYAIFENAIQARRLKFGVIAGHSLGHLTALVAARSIDLVTALNLVQLRGQLMKATTQFVQSGMLAVQNISIADLSDMITAHSELSIWIANINSSSQIVVSGVSDDLRRFQSILRKSKYRSVLLNVSGAFHSPIFKEAATTFEKTVEHTKISPPIVPVLRNRDGAQMTTVQEIKDDLKTQMVEQVDWLAVVNSMRALGVAEYIESGPGRILKGLVLKIDRTAIVYETNSPAKLELLPTPSVKECAL